jgi:hypothetical protein
LVVDMVVALTTEPRLKLVVMAEVAVAELIKVVVVELLWQVKDTMGEQALVLMAAAGVAGVPGK